MYRFLLLTAILVFTSCDKETALDTSCPEAANILEQFVQPTGEEVIITSDGLAYQVIDGTCELFGTYFSTTFKEDNYQEVGGEVFIITDEGLVQIKNEWIEDFEEYNSFVDMFAVTIADSNRIWNTMTMQSPMAQTVQEYVDLKNCILDGTCDFLDNQLELTADPMDANNQCLKFTAVAPVEGMVTSKSSMRSFQQYFEKGDDLWFSGRFYMEGGLPFTLVDFENGFFEGSPGPRLIISNDRFAIENKFGEKTVYRHDKNTLVELGRWITVKVHFQFDNGNGGMIELWQDGELLFSYQGTNMPTFNSIQNSLEVGISATQNDCVLYLDDVRLSTEPF